MTISVHAVGGYWKAWPTVDGRRRQWSFGSIAEASEQQAQTALKERLNSRRGASNTSRHTVDALIERYLEHAREFYVRDDGRPTGEADNLYYGLAPLVALFGKARADDMRPRHIDVFVKSQKRDDVSRQMINTRIRMIKRLLKWGKNKELVTPAPLDACRDYESLKAGKGFREAKSIRAVPAAQVEQTLRFLPVTIRAMVQLQQTTAMRPEEVCALRLMDIDMGQSPWLYVPEWHKKKWRGQQRRIFLGPNAREILKPFLIPGNTLAPIFSPRQAIKERRGKMPSPRMVGEFYDTRSYRKAIWYACDQAFPLPEILRRLRVEANGRKRWRLESVAEWRKRIGEEKVEEARGWRKENRWSPNQLRKSGLDAVRRIHGKQAAKSIAGHSRVETTQDFYLSQDDELAQKVAEKAG